MANILPKATHTGKLQIGDIDIACAVLEDGTRLITQRSMYAALGRSVSTGGLKKGGKQELPRFLAPKNLSPFISDELACAAQPMKFKPKSSGAEALGFKADLLPEICEVYLDARIAGVLRQDQNKFATQCEMLVRSFAKIGIVALVDEATGYQYDRAKNDLSKILEAYIAKELLPWQKRFPDEFYQEMFRLKGWKYPKIGTARPGVVGKYTNDIIYDRMPPGIIKELKEKNPTDDKGRRKNKHHQFLTDDIGHPHLEKQLTGAMALMRASSNWMNFKRSLERAYPKPELQLDFDDIEPDTLE